MDYSGVRLAPAFGDECYTTGSFKKTETARDAVQGT